MAEHPANSIQFDSVFPFQFPFSFHWAWNEWWFFGKEKEENIEWNINWWKIFYFLSIENRNYSGKEWRVASNKQYHWKS